MKTTKNVVDLNEFKKALFREAKENKRCIRHIFFSSQGAGKLLKFKGSKQEVYNLTKKGNGDVIGFLGSDEDYLTFFITGSKPDTKVKAPKNMSGAFIGLGSTNRLPTIKSIDVSGLDVSNTNNFDSCFRRVGSDSIQGVRLIGLGTWDTSQAKYMRSMFSEYNNCAKDTSLDLSGFNVSNVETFRWMFQDMAYNSEELNIVGIEGWKFSKTEYVYMDHMFRNLGKMTNYELDLSSWKPRWHNAAGDISYTLPSEFASGTFFKIKSPYSQAEKH